MADVQADIDTDRSMTVLMITMREWFGPSRAGLQRPIADRQEVEIRLRGFVTNLPLSDALRRIHAYQRAFNDRYADGTAIEFALLSVSPIEQLSADVIEMCGAVHVEQLKQSGAEWE